MVTDNKDSTRRRRNSYATNVDYHDRTKEGNRDRYWEGKSKPSSPVSVGLLIPANDREVYKYEDSSSEYVNYPCYTINEAAEAIGKSHSTMKRWIVEGAIPAPILKDSSYGYAQYTKGEVELILELIQGSMNGKAYLSNSDTEKIERIRQRIEGYRKSNI